MSILPILNEAFLEDKLGTSKLNNVVKKRIDNIIDDKEITQLEKFCTVFLYSDFKGKEYLGVIKKYIGNLKHNYVKDMTLLKLISYYYIRSDTKTSDLKYENLIADLIRSSNAKFNKSHLMENCRKNKEIYTRENKMVDYNL